MTMEPYQLNQLRIRRLTTNVYLTLVCFGLPLVFTRFFFNITETKHVFFIVSSLVYALALILIAILLPKGYGVAKAEQAPVAPALWFLAAFFICLVLGGLLGGHPEDAFFGQNNRYQGILSVFTYCLVALALSRQTLSLRFAEAAVAAGAALVGTLGLINHYGLDPFGFMTNLTAFDKGRFLSTIGNADFYGSYLSLAFPVTFGLFLHAGQKRTRVLSALALVCVSFGALVAGSDSTALGMIAAAVVFPLVLFSDPRGLRRYFAGWAVFALSALCFGLLSPVLPSATYLSAFCVIVSKMPVALGLLLACLVFWLVMKKAPPRASAPREKGLLDHAACRGGSLHCRVDIAQYGALRRSARQSGELPALFRKLGNRPGQDLGVLSARVRRIHPRSKALWRRPRRAVSRGRTEPRLFRRRAGHRA